VSNFEFARQLPSGPRGMVFAMPGMVKPSGPGCAISWPVMVPILALGVALRVDDAPGKVRRPEGALDGCGFCPGVLVVGMPWRPGAIAWSVSAETSAGSPGLLAACRSPASGGAYPRGSSTGDHPCGRPRVRTDQPALAHRPESRQHLASMMTRRATTVARAAGSMAR
jgi:hypothetical protein